MASSTPIPSILGRDSALALGETLSLPALPSLVSEWAAIIPLICHLASPQHDYELVGQVSLAGRISLSICPKLGVLSGLSRLPHGGAAFLNETCSLERPNWQVWDVRWGSRFPCANSSASSAIASYALQTAKESVIHMPGTIRDYGSSEAKEDFRSSGSSSESLAATSRTRTRFPSSTIHRRPQTLHVIRFGRQHHQRSWLSRLESKLDSFAFTLLISLLCLSIAGALPLFGLYGTALMLTCAVVSRACCRMLPIGRAPDYLENNETDSSSCMLISAHQNARVWYLFVGNRGVVNTLLNKTMFSISPSSSNKTISQILYIIHGLQIVAMTFVAGRKGWDGVGLVALIVLSLLGRWRHSTHRAVERWLHAEAIHVNARSFLFTGRTLMLGAIQSFSGSNTTAWMDDIVTPVARRNAWLDRLGSLSFGLSCSESEKDDGSGWSAHD